MYHSYFYHLLKNKSVIKIEIMENYFKSVCKYNFNLACKGNT